jgi:hypothetical protein
LVLSCETSEGILWIIVRVRFICEVGLRRWNPYGLQPASPTADNQHRPSMVDLSSSQIKWDNTKVNNSDGYTLCPIVPLILPAIQLTP